MSVDCTPAAYNEGLTSHLSPIPLQFSSSRKYLQFAGHSVALFQSASLLTFYKQAHHSLSLNLRSSEEAYLNYNKSKPVEAVSYSSLWLQRLTDLTCTSTAQASPVISNLGKHLLPTQTPELQELLLLVDCSDRIRKKKTTSPAFNQIPQHCVQIIPFCRFQTDICCQYGNKFFSHQSPEARLYIPVFVEKDVFFFSLREVAQLKLMRHNTKCSQGSKCCKDYNFHSSTKFQTVNPSFLNMKPNTRTPQNSMV